MRTRASHRLGQHNAPTQEARHMEHQAQKGSSESILNLDILLLYNNNLNKNTENSTRATDYNCDLV